MQKEEENERRRWVPHYPVTVSMSKLFSTLAAANRILAVWHPSASIPSDLGCCGKSGASWEDFEVFSSVPKADGSSPGGQTTSRVLVRQTQAEQEAEPWQPGEESLLLHATNRHLHLQV